MRGLLFGVVAILVLLAAAVVIVPSFIDWNTYKPEIVAAVRNATGRDLAIDGDIRLKVLPAPALSVGAVRFANLEGAPTPSMATLRALEVRVALAPLLGGEVQVESVRLVEPTIVLEVLADGRASWDLPAAEAEPGRPGGAGGTGGPALQLDRVEVADGTLIYRDVAAGTDLRVEGLSLVGSAVSLDGPFEATGEARLGDLPLTFVARSGRLGQAGGVPVLLSLGLQGEAGSLTIAGEVRGGGAETAFAGTVRASAADPAALLAKAGIEARIPKPLAGKLELDGRVEGSAGQLAANDLTLRLGEMQATGAVSAALRGQPRVDATVAVNRIDLDAFLAALADGAAGAAEDAEPAAAAALPMLPPELAASLNLTVDGIAYRDGVLRQVRLAAALDKGVLTIAQAGALLPGGSDLKLSGKLALAEQPPQFEGRVEMTSDNLRGLLGWLQVDVERVPAGRLGNMALTGALTATPELVQLYGMNLRLDASTITGGMAFLLQARPSFGIDLAIDRINVDGYLPPLGGPGGSPLAALDRFDTNFKLKVGKLTYSRTPVDDLDLDLSLIGGRLELRKATVGNLAGASASLAASGTGFGTPAPQLDAKLRLLANDVTGLARLAGLQLPVPPASLGKADVTASLSGTAERLALDTQASLGRIALTAKGAVAEPLAAPRVEATVQLDHPSLAELSRLLKLGLAPLSGADAPVALTGAVKGGAQSLAIDGEARAAGATLTTAGRLSELAATPKLDVAVNVVHADLRGFLRGLGVHYDPALRDLGGLGLSARIQGDVAAMTISDLNGVLGPVQLAGTGTVRLDRPRPYVSAELRTNELDAGLFLAPAAPDGAAGGGAEAAPAAPAAGRWSREPVDLGALGELDADLRLTADGLRAGAYHFVEPELTLRLERGVLQVAPLTGRLFDGTVTLNARLESRPRPAVELAVDLQGADLRQALVAAAGLDKVGGRVDLQGEVATAGSSAWALVSNLNGTARVSGGDGAVRGLDMRLLSDRLGQLNKLPDFLDLAARAFSGGETALRRIDGTWTIADGIARTDDTQAALEASDAHLAGTVNLPAWEMDLAATLQLTEHRDAPPVTVELSGPLDNPRREAKTRALEQFVARRLGETVIRKSLGEDGEALDRLLDQTLGGGRTDAKDTAKEVLEDLLKKN